jgi:hypothetical protein
VHENIYWHVIYNRKEQEVAVNVKLTFGRFFGGAMHEKPSRVWQIFLPQVRCAALGITLWRLLWDKRKGFPTLLPRNSQYES